MPLLSIKYQLLWRKKNTNDRRILSSEKAQHRDGVTRESVERYLDLGIQQNVPEVMEDVLVATT